MEKSLSLHRLSMHSHPVLPVAFNIFIDQADTTTLYYLQRFCVGHVEPGEAGGHVPRPRALERFQEGDLNVKRQQTKEDSIFTVISVLISSPLYAFLDRPN